MILTGKKSINILIDTQICIWSIYDNDRLSDKTISLLKDAENYTYVIAAGLSGQRRRVLCRKRPLYLLKRGTVVFLPVRKQFSGRCSRRQDGDTRQSSRISRTRTMHCGKVLDMIE